LLKIKTLYIDLSKTNNIVEIENKIDIVSFKEIIEEGLAVTINNLFID